jgi:hypothetical protein
MTPWHSVDDPLDPLQIGKVHLSLRQVFCVYVTDVGGPDDAELRPRGWQCVPRRGTSGAVRDCQFEPMLARVRRSL